MRHQLITLALPSDNAYDYTMCDLDFLFSGLPPSLLPEMLALSGVESLRLLAK